MSSKSMSPDRERSNRIQEPERERNNRRQDPDCHKVFLTNLNGEISQQQLQTEVKKLFQKYGEVEKLSLKKQKNGYYYFAFLEFPKGFNSFEAVKALDQYPLFGKNMKVRQDRQSQGCFKCGSMGHFARQCPNNRDRDRDRRRSYSNQRRGRDSRRYDSRDKYQRRDRDRDNRDRYERHDRHDRGHDRRDRDRERERERDQRHGGRRNRSRSHSNSRSSSESSHYRRPERKDRKDRKRRSRS